MIVGVFTALGAGGAEAPYERLKTEGERAYEEKSYARAAQIYEQAKGVAASTGEKEWVEFRLADSGWRALSGSRQEDEEAAQGHREALRRMIESFDKAGRDDGLWRQVVTSLGDSFLRRGSGRWDFGQAWGWYDRVFKRLASSTQLEAARRDYVDLALKVTEPVRASTARGSFLHVGVSNEVLENSVKLSRTTAERGWFHYLLARNLQQQGHDPNFAVRITEEYESAIQFSANEPWLDQTLFHAALWFQQSGKWVFDDSGNILFTPDFPRAVATYRRILELFPEGKSPFRTRAEQLIREATELSVSVRVDSHFSPDSSIPYHLTWRNTPVVKLSLYPVVLTEVAGLRSNEAQMGWMNRALAGLGGKPLLRSWSYETKDSGEHLPGAAREFLEEKLARGAYLLVVEAGGKKAVDLVLVTDAALVLNSDGATLLAFFCDATTGSPISGAGVTAWVAPNRQNGADVECLKLAATTGADGLAKFDLPKIAREGWSDYVVFAGKDGRQAFARQSGPRSAVLAGDSDHQEPGRWRFHVFTDRPAYRPGEVVKWKLTARREEAAGDWRVPVRRDLVLAIKDAEGTTLDQRGVLLNEFGSAWGEFEVKPEHKLGMFLIAFGKARQPVPATELSQEQVRGMVELGSAPLFRLEEYKLPEFQVAVKTPEENGKPKRFILGDLIEVEISADYYFGGAVAGADVEVVVRQNPHYPIWREQSEFDWFFPADPEFSGRGGRGGQEVDRRQLRTDNAGKAKLTIQSPAFGSGDIEYSIEARVTDASRREIIASGSARVTRAPYSVHASMDHRVVRPGTKATATFRSMDANENPLAVEGAVTVVRQHWWEIWIDPDGKEVKGPELVAARARHPIFPPPNPGPGKGWRLKFRGYEREEVSKHTVATGESGEGKLVFTPQRPGYYSFEWLSGTNLLAQGSRPIPPIQASAALLVADDLSGVVGYNSGGLEILLDQDMVRPGGKLPVLVTTPQTGAHVLLLVMGASIDRAEVLRMDGTTRLVEIEVAERLAPNFLLRAVMVHDNQQFQAEAAVKVPPVKNFLDVTLTASQGQYEPREKGEFEITVRDSRGNPRSAEVGFSLADESVFYIQSELAQDIRKAFLPGSRGIELATGGSLLERALQRFDHEEEKLKEELLQTNQTALRFLGRGAGLAGREERFAAKSARGSVAFDFAPPPAPASMAATRLYSMADAAAPLNSAGLIAPTEAEDGEASPNVVVRSDFRSTLLWRPDLKTGADGRARIDAEFADSLTRWRGTARVASQGMEFGEARVTARTRLPLTARLQAPRFFTAGDQVVVSGLVNNNSDGELKVVVSLKAGGVSLGSPVSTQVTLAPGAEARVDWLVLATKPGEAVFELSAKAGNVSDAMTRSYPIFEHGIEKLHAAAGRLVGESALIQLELPKDHRPGSAKLTLRATPSLAVTMLDALPYLIDYPYGCVEQTMSRFLPAVVVAKTLTDLRLDPEIAFGRTFGSVDPANAATRKAVNLEKLAEVAKQGLARIADFQKEDGSWGWWKEGESDPFMTAFVVWGLTLAAQAELEVDRAKLGLAAEWLERRLVQAVDEPDLQAWLLHAAAVHHQFSGKGQASEFTRDAMAGLYGRRDQLNAYGRALLALAANALGDGDRAKVLVRNLENGVVWDRDPAKSILQPGSTAAPKPATAHWGRDGISWRWAEGAVESTAFALRALLAIDPGNALIEPASLWLIQNRRGAQWSNTRDTAIAILSMTRLLERQGAALDECEFEVLAGGRSVVRQSFSRETLFSAPRVVEIPSELLVGGTNEVAIKRLGGTAPLYYAAELTFFDQSEPIAPAGNMVFLKRDFFRLVPRQTLLSGVRFDRVPLPDGGELTSGERVEVRLLIEVKNDAEYLIFEDLKAAGLEAVETQSGPMTAFKLRASAARKLLAEGGDMPAWEARGDQSRLIRRELRDRKAAFFADKLTEGFWEIRHELRAESPGVFHGLPVIGQAMYAPEIRGNGAEIRLRVADKPAR